ncbi:MAG: host-nuclease inhibitor Gam family protein [Planctomycetes bacterium]|nr:host-nuclease inhibitor Gam family protein [Planctomycetota bacterium]
MTLIEIARRVVEVCRQESSPAEAEQHVARVLEESLYQPPRFALPELLQSVNEDDELKLLIENDDQLHVAAGELAWMNTVASLVNAWADDACRPIRNAANEAQQLAGVPFADRRRLLQEAMEAYCKAHRPRLFGKLKTHKLRHGTVSFSKSRGKLVFYSGKDPDWLMKRLYEGPTQLLTRITQWLEDTPLVAEDEEGNRIEIKATRLLDFKPTVSLSRATECRKAGSISDAELKAFGLRWAEGTETFAPKPSAIAVESASREPTPA